MFLKLLATLTLLSLIHSSWLFPDVIPVPTIEEDLDSISTRRNVRSLAYSPETNTILIIFTEGLIGLV
jgi:hypothetical protein